MKKALKSTEDKARLQTTFDVIYSYSHQKFYEFIGIPEIRVIFSSIMAKTGLENFINNHESLGKDKYRDHIKSIMDKVGPK